MFETEVVGKIRHKFYWQKLCRLWDNVEKYCRSEQTTYDNIAHTHAHCVLDF